MSLKRVEMIFGIILVPGFLVAMGGAAMEKSILIALGMTAMVGALIFRIVFYRCPHCGRYLDRNSGKYCQYCGKETGR